MPALIAHDADWQFPAVTEAHAFRRMRAAPLGGTPGAYVGFPWATLIDRIENRAPGAEALLGALDALPAPVGGPVATVCQHIGLARHAHLLERAGVTDVFWSHAPRGARLGGGGRIRAHPFPLYPVQQPPPLPDDAPRRWLYCFIGARAEPWYLTRVRDWIVEALYEDPRGCVRGRRGWHYDRVVYEHQIAGVAATRDLVDAAASEEFAAALRSSVFALCPSGSGPNSIRLWEAIAAGVVPVVLSDSYAPPGDPTLWAEATVSAPETPEAVAALPDRLEALAADAEALARKRAALRQLRFRYGPDDFVHDLRRLFLDVALRPPAPTEALTLNDAPGRMAALAAEDDAAAEALLTAMGARLTVDPAAAEARLDADPRLAAACEVAAARRPEAARFYRRAGGSASGAPWKADSRLRVCLSGRHAHRTPLAYAPYRMLLEQKVVHVNKPDLADVVIFAFDLDIRENAAALIGLRRRRPDVRLVLFSEEPLWDTAWRPFDPERLQTLTVDGEVLDYIFLCHANCDVFEFERIPYFVTTDDRFILEYGPLLARNAAETATEIAERWRNASIPVAFIAERRTGPEYAVDLPEHQIFGLGAYRTHLADAVTLPGTLRAGYGWSDQRRQALPDWRLDKLSMLDRRAHIVSALENTHQNRYVTEKLFDAFAVGARPLYYAGPNHAVWRLAPRESLINLHDLSVEEAAALIERAEVHAMELDAHREAQSTLARIFEDIDALIAERRRIADAIVAALEWALSSAPDQRPPGL